MSRGAGAEHRRLLRLQHFGVSGPEAAESRVRCLFDGGERRLAHHRSHTPQAASPATQPPAYPLEPLTPALPPLSTPPVCSWQANFARSTSSLATILESIVAYSTRCARWCARFLRPTRPRGTPAAAALLPAAGLPDHVFCRNSVWGTECLECQGQCVIPENTQLPFSGAIKLHLRKCWSPSK